MSPTKKPNKTATPAPARPSLLRSFRARFSAWLAASSGPRNLVFLGVAAVLITFATVSVSLKLYHDSGDIYLDRSRPGFLPEKEEAEEDADPADYSFPDSGTLSEEDLTDFLTNLKSELNRLNDFSSDPFSPVPLSDDTLGL